MLLSCDSLRRLVATAYQAGSERSIELAAASCSSLCCLPKRAQAACTILRVLHVTANGEMASGHCGLSFVPVADSGLSAANSD